MKENQDKTLKLIRRLNTWNVKEMGPYQLSDEEIMILLKVWTLLCSISEWIGGIKSKMKIKEAEYDREYRNTYKNTVKCGMAAGLKEAVRYLEDEPDALKEWREE